MQPVRPRHSQFSFLTHHPYLGPALTLLSASLQRDEDASEQSPTLFSSPGTQSLSFPAPGCSVCSTKLPETKGSFLLLADLKQQILEVTHHSRVPNESYSTLLFPLYAKEANRV